MKKILFIILSGCLPLLSFGQIKTCDATLYMVNASNDTLPFSYAFVILVNGQNTEGEFQTDQNGKFQFQFDPSDMEDLHQVRQGQSCLRSTDASCVGNR